MSSKWNHGLRITIITQHYLINYGQLVEVWPNSKWIVIPLLWCLSMSDHTEDVNFLIRLKMRWNCIWPRSGAWRLLNNPHIRWVSLWLLSQREHGRLNGREMEPFGLHCYTLYLTFSIHHISCSSGHLLIYSPIHWFTQSFSNSFTNNLLTQWSFLRIYSLLNIV